MWRCRAEINTRPVCEDKSVFIFFKFYFHHLYRFGLCGFNSRGVRLQAEQHQPRLFGGTCQECHQLYTLYCYNILKNIPSGITYVPKSAMPCLCAAKLQLTPISQAGKMYITSEICSYPSTSASLFWKMRKISKHAQHKVTSLKCCQCQQEPEETSFF